MSKEKQHTTDTKCRYLWRVLKYNLVNIDDYKIFENREIAVGAPQPWKYSKDCNKAPLSATLIQCLKDLKSVAYVVIKEGEIIQEHYWEGYSATSLSNSFSMAKSITAFCVGAALQDGLIASIDDPVRDYLPRFNEKNHYPISIKHLLTMSSGTSWSESYINPFSVTTKAYYGRDLRAVLQALEYQNEPGKYFNYLSGDTAVLGMLVEKVSGMTLSEYASEKLWKPMGAVHPALWSLDKKSNGLEKAYCCFNSNAKDFARFGQLMLNEGAWQGEQLIPKDFMQALMTPNGLLDPKTDEPTDCYGYQSWIYNDDNFKNVPYMRGILGQYVIALKEENTIIVRLGKKRGKFRNGKHPDEVKIFLNHWKGEG